MTNENLILRIKNRMASLISVSDEPTDYTWTKSGLLMQAKRFPEIHVAEVRAYFILNAFFRNAAEATALEDKVNAALNPTSNLIARFVADPHSQTCLLETTQENLASAITKVQSMITSDFDVFPDMAISIPFEDRYIIGIRTKEEAETFLEDRELAFKIASA